MVVSSAAIKSARYSERLKALDLTFTSGHRYLYLGVTRATFRALTRGESAGKAYHAKVKGRHPVYKVSPGTTDRQIRTAARVLSTEGGKR